MHQWQYFTDQGFNRDLIDVDHSRGSEGYVDSNTEPRSHISTSAALEEIVSSVQVCCFQEKSRLEDTLAEGLVVHGTLLYRTMFANVFHAQY